MKLRNVLIAGLLICFLIPGLRAQESAAPFDLSFEFQAYPTGLIPGIRLEKGFGDQNAVHLRLGYQWIRHRDLGVHADERGQGYGFTLGYKRYLKEDFKGLHFGVKTDFWFNELDWKDNIDTEEEISGATKITVFQPTAEAGFLLPLGASGFFTPTIAFGVEINVKTDGEPVGEGAILLLGFQIGKRF